MPACVQACVPAWSVSGLPLLSRCSRALASVCSLRGNALDNVTKAALAAADSCCGTQSFVSPPKDKCYQYWPTEGSVVHGDITIEIKSDSLSEGISVRDFLVTCSQVWPTQLASPCLALALPSPQLAGSRLSWVLPHPCCSAGMNCGWAQSAFPGPSLVPGSVALCVCWAGNGGSDEPG